MLVQFVDSKLTIKLTIQCCVDSTTSVLQPTITVKAKPTSSLVKCDCFALQTSFPVLV